MADKSVGELIAAQSVTPTDLFVLEQNGTAKKLTGQILENWLVSFADGHGGIQSIAKLSTSGLADTYRITLADTTTFDFVVTNGRGVHSLRKTETSGLVDTYTFTYNDGNIDTFTVTNGEKGKKGDNAYIWIKYASQKPTSSSNSIGDIPDDWMGVYFGTASTAPTDWQLYKWYRIKGEKGDTGEPATLVSSEIRYQVSNSGSIIPSGSWSDSIPVVAQGRYLWTRTTNTFNTGSPVVAYSVSRMGIDGAGSVSSVAGISPGPDGNVPLTASDVHARPDDWVPTAEEVGALPDNKPVTIVNGGTNATTVAEAAKNISRRKVKIFGDSYGVGGSQSGVTYDPYAYYISQWLPNCESCDNISESGRGFVKESDFSKLTFEHSIDAQTADDEVTDVIIAGGYNDIVYTQSEIETAMASAIYKAKQKYQNARVYVAFIANSWFASEYDKIISACTVYKRCTHYGAIFCENCNWVMHNLDYFDSDHIHPNQNGHIRIATALLQVLNGITPDIIEPEKSIVWPALNNNGNNGNFEFRVSAYNGIGSVSRGDSLPIILSSLGSRTWNGNNLVQITGEADSGYFRGHNGVEVSVPCVLNANGILNSCTCTLKLVNGAWYVDIALIINGSWYTGAINDCTMYPFNITFSRSNN